MSASKAERSRFWVAYFIDDMPVGTEFMPGALHLTLIPWFVADKTDKEINESFEDYFSRFSAFNIHLGEKAKFGPKKDAPITLVEPTFSIMELHEACLSWLDKLSGRWAVKNPYIGVQYRPHIRRRRGTRLTQQVININSITLVSAARREDHIRHVAAKVALK
ncbi:2'-5' RNA ligase family protein [Candidatus Saccharibacteria bacterium]|nr:2'-5' RNA ligase family protein [Candidatus Saccharibacteria bacterium]